MSEGKAAGVFLSRRSIVIVAVLLVILWAGSNVLCWYLGRESMAKQVESGGITYDSEGTTSQGDGTTLPSPKIPIYAVRTIEANTTDVKLSFFNPIENENAWYVEYTMILADTGEELYKSKLLKPGEAITKITLNRPLEVGTYNISLVATPYTMETMSKGFANAASNFTLNAK